MSQTNNILGYLEQGNMITPKDAYDKFGCLRLSERIREIEAQGIAINHEWVKLPNGKRVMGYKLAREQQMMFANKVGV